MNDSFEADGSRCDQRSACNCSKVKASLGNVTHSHSTTYGQTKSQSLNGKKKTKLVYFQRRRRSGRNFSLEQVFDDVRTRLSAKFDSKVWVAPVTSNGLFRRLWIALTAVFQQGEVNHVTGDINFATLFLRREKTILTILDCGILERSFGIRRKLILIFWFQLPVMRAQIITVISKATMQSLLQRVHCPPDRIRIVPVAISEHYKPVPRSFNSCRPRILQIGTAPNKNLERVILALASVPCVLSIVGPLDEQNRRLLKENGVEFESAEDLTTEALIQEYVDCDLVVFASTYEGFGMPILEGNAVGRPVITSNVASMPEVAGDAACLVDPFDVHSIRGGIVRIIEDHEYRQQLVIKGFANVKRFRAEAIATQYEEIYNEIASTKAA